jgi:hypothetical protein
VEQSHEVVVEELRRQIRKISWRELSKYQAIRVAQFLAEAAIELVVVAREVDEDVRLLQAHRTMKRLLSEIERLV